MLPRAAAGSAPIPASISAPVPAEPGLPAVPELGHGSRRPFTLPPLPYAESALAPAISSRTVFFHYHRHHAGYLATLNRLLSGHPLAGRPLVGIIRDSAGQAARSSLFNNAAQVWNHSFYWRSLTPGGGGRPRGGIGAAVDRSFGSYTALREQLLEAALGQFGSGWVWLCAEDDRLTLRRTGNAETPIQVPGVTPLLTIDVWEHAYYLDSQNRRADHVTQVIDRLLDWSWANRIQDAHLRQAGLAAGAHSPPADAAPPGTRGMRGGDTRAASFARLAGRR